MQFFNKSEAKIKEAFLTLKYGTIFFFFDK